MSDQINYDYAGLATLVEDITSKKGSLTSTNSDLLGFVKGLAAAWESDAQASYQAVQDRWQAAHVDLLDTLGAISNAVHNAHNDMQSTDLRNAGTWH